MGKKMVNPKASTEDDIDIGQRIRLQRVRLDMSQSDLAQRLGVSFQQIQKYEKGINRISGQRMRTLCEMLEVDPNYLLGWKRKATQLDEMRHQDSLDIRMAQKMGQLPIKLRAPVHELIIKLTALQAKDLK